jgi:DNA-binding NarL/FixJ family response regulator
VLADDHSEMRVALVHTLEGTFDVVAAVSDGASAVQAVIDLRPDVAVLDISMPGTGGFEAARQIQKLGLPTKVVFLCIEATPIYVQAAIAMGARYVVKSNMKTELVTAIQQVTGH